MERHSFYPELVYLLSQTGQTKRALNLIITRLDDVSLAISFAKEQDDPELWDDLLEYSMDKPVFIRGLLEEAGTSLDPVRLVRAIPEGLHVEGLKGGVVRMVREFELQGSISEGVARVLRGEVNAGMDALRRGRARAVKFDVIHHHPPPPQPNTVELKVEPVKSTPSTTEEATILETSIAIPDDGVDTHDHDDEEKPIPPGHCAGCRFLFLETEEDTLIGFACGHVYHLSCLVSRIKTRNPDLADAAERMMNSIRRERAEDEGYPGGGGGGYGRSVGSKVAHAHIMRNVVGEGCVRCHYTSKESGDGE